MKLLKEYLKTVDNKAKIARDKFGITRALLHYYSITDPNQMKVSTLKKIGDVIGYNYCEIVAGGK